MERISNSPKKQGSGLRAFQCLALCGVFVGLVLLFVLADWAIPLEVAGEISASLDPEYFDTDSAIDRKRLMLGGVAFPLVLYAVGIIRSMYLSSHRVFCFHTTWFLLLLCVLPLLALMFQPHSSQSPIKSGHWLMLLLALLFLVLLCVRWCRMKVRGHLRVYCINEKPLLNEQ